MFWFLEDPDRLAAERDGIAELAGEAEWLDSPIWAFDEARLCVDFSLLIGTRIYRVRLRYPSHYPTVGPSVLPRSATERWSSHQYGRDGELCTEWGPDTWHSSILGRAVIESAFKLLSSEADEFVNIPSRHFESEGQQLRGVTLRLAIWDEDVQAIRSTLVSGETAAVQLSCCKVGVGYRFSLSAFDDSEVGIDIRGRIDGPVDFKCPGYIVRSTEAPSVGVGAGRDQVLALISKQFAGLDLGAFESQYGATVVWVPDSGEVVAQWIWASSFTDVAVLSFSDNATRSGGVPSLLRERSVCVVGVGSVGGRVALSLARSGIGKLFLVDHDILRPENLSRHVLGRGSLADHKVDAMKLELNRSFPSVEVSTSRIMFGGQEANASVDFALRKVAECDLIIDATADSHVFSVVSHVARNRGAAFIWMEVFGGGIGGLVANYRPETERTPERMRDSLLAWIAEQGVAPPSDAGVKYYGAARTDGSFEVALDADVGLISCITSLIAIDNMCGTGRFPHSLYLIGLSADWLFREPLHVIPIDLFNGGSESSGKVADVKPEVVVDNIEFIQAILERGGSSNETQD